MRAMGWRSKFFLLEVPIFHGHFEHHGAQGIDDAPAALVFGR